MRAIAGVDDAAGRPTRPCRRRVADRRRRRAEGPRRPDADRAGPRADGGRRGPAVRDIAATLVIDPADAHLAADVERPGMRARGRAVDHVGARRLGPPGRRHAGRRHRLTGDATGAENANGPGAEAPGPNGRVMQRETPRGVSWRWTATHQQGGGTGTGGQAAEDQRHGDVATGVGQQTVAADPRLRRRCLLADLVGRHGGTRGGGRGGGLS